ncbi:LapA family protein [Clostridium tagluense]|uniref:Lipopolysaccharide assembly protein A domain-containing protein n=1 Tax=Clostridium tagluense TaxID=360422 RepID=A0A401UHA5_9CLOT|nr:LapA family protein [Clostridium tagluense]GCD08859.1 hypothetical protein Ctaglu_04820 [Clostridium tagluense]
MRFGFIISLLFAILVALFGIQNSSVISINFFFTKFNISLALIIFVSAITGAIIVTLLGLQKEITLRRGNKRLTKKAKNFEIQNETFKNKIETLETQIVTLETTIALNAKSNILNDEINTQNIEIKHLNNISSNKTDTLT